MLTVDVDSLPSSLASRLFMVLDVQSCQWASKSPQFWPTESPHPEDLSPFSEAHWNQLLTCGV
jgi:hypothetical protein